MAERRPEDAERLEALRRRLYAPDVSASEVEAYQEAQHEAVVPADPPEAPPLRRSRLPFLVVVAALVVAVGAFLIVGRPAAAPERSAPASPGARTFAPPAPPTAVQIVAVPASTRSAFVRALGSGKQAGVLAYFFRNPDALPDQLRTTTRAASTEYSGRGTDTITLDPSALAEPGGRMTVVLTLDRAAKWEWRAAALEEPDRRFDDALIGGDGAPGSPMSATLTYRAGAPDQLLVLVADDVRWDAVVDFTD